MGRMPTWALRADAAVVVIGLALGLGLAACSRPSGDPDPAVPSATGRTTGAVVTDAAATATVETAAAEPRPAPTVPVREGTSDADLGIELKGGTFLPLIDRGTALPASTSENFTTDEDNQETIKIAVFYSVSASLADARRIGGYELSVPAAQPKGVPQIRVTFDVDAGGVFRLTATDSATGAPVTVTARN
ncbi:Hsp70 family protein [Kineosporia sp. R_H_3]|uniref:Hsp70 family protein n=1 Tax=Kineosporia sp. R_H_3 TaxID=1961848 RepID=UPI0013040F9A|nr:Hsp70 family protein [Kineosporia sp. R_H_3]